MVFKNILNLNCHNDDIICLAYSSSGFLASCSLHDINIWDSKSFNIIASLKDNKAKFECIAFSNHKLISGSDLNLKIWNPSTGECLQTFEDIKRVKSICVLKDGKIAVAQKTGIIIFNENFEKISEVNDKNYSIVGLGQLNNGNLVMVCEKQIKIFEINTLIVIETINNIKNNTAFKVLQDGSLAIGCDSQVNILDKDNLRLKFKIECKKKEITCIESLSDGSLIVGHSDDQIKGSFDIFSGPTYENIENLIEAYPVKSLLVIPRDTIISGQMHGDINIWFKSI